MQTHTAPKLVIFDCDGVLVDTEPLIREALLAAIAGLGLRRPTDAQIMQYKGIAPEMVRVLLGSHIDTTVPHNFVERWKQEILRLLPKSRAVPGVADALRQLRLPRCVASSGDPHKIAESLSVTGLSQYFEPHTYFSATQVKNGKPAPDLFLLAANSLGADPGSCVVVEDSVPGVQGAVAAGMTAYAYCAETPAEELAVAGAVITFDDMSKLPKLLRLPITPVS